MDLRYTDIALSSTAKSADSDFLPRNRKPTLLQLIIIFFLALVVCVCVLVTILNKGQLAAWLILILGAAGWYSVVQVQRSRDLILATEFQNALFASALGFNNKFCLIIKREGSIIYMDNAFQKMFPDLLKERHVNIASMLKHGKVEQAVKEKIFASLERGVYDKIIFEIRSSDNRIHKIVMSIEPIIRPSGFILLRSREYIEQRAAKPEEQTAAATTAASNPLLNKSSVTLFSYIMDRMNMGVYMTDPAGNLIYANPTLEQWLSYRDGEITSSTLALRELVHNSSEQASRSEPRNFEGEVTLIKKEGGLLKAYINQKIIQGDDGKILGCVGLINSINIDNDPTIKKTLW